MAVWRRLTFAILVAASGCASVPTEDTSKTATTVEPSTTTEATSTTAPTSSEPSTTTTVPPTAAAPPATTTSTDALLDQLAVAPEASRDGYDRDLFDHWSTQPDGCSTRERVLIDEAIDPPSVGSGCSVSGGRWVSAYDGVEVTDPGDIDIDHMVPLAEAWDSGANTWDAGRREQYANDLGLPDTLIAVTASSNRSKSDQDPAQRTPPVASYRCIYATSWVAVKIKWQLSADPAEVDALRSMLDGCTGTPGTAPTATTSAPAPTTSGPATGPVVYENCDAARAAGAAPIREGEPGYSTKLDRDGDGVACE